MVWFEYIGTKGTFPVKIDDWHNGFIYGTTIKKAEKRLLKEFVHALIIREVKN